MADLLQGPTEVQQAGDEAIALAVQQRQVLAGTAQQDGALDLF